MKLWVLGSGSGGNAVLVECGESRVLVDAGFSPRELASRLRTIGVAPASIEACIVTHEHTDHVKGAAAGARQWGWSLFASAGTVDAWPDLQAAGCIGVTPGTSITLSRVVVTTEATPHDSASPIGVRLACTATGATTVVCTDIGHVSENVRALCAGADLLVLESNHDEQMLRSGPYPMFLQRRIASRTGHLSNRASAELTRDLVHRDLAHVILAHLSEPCNEPALAMSTVSSVLADARFRGTLTAATQRGVAGPFEPNARRRGPPAQLSLGL